MGLSWYIGRLRNMSAAEITHRVGEKLRRMYSRGRHEGWARYGKAGGSGELALPGLREAVLKADPAMRGAIGRAAAAVLDGEFSALGVAWPVRQADDLFPASLWSLDPITGKTWPGRETYCFDVDFRQVGVLGDIKYVWEINRLQFLQPLACQALLTGDANAVAAIEVAIASWHASNPPFRGVGWASGIEVALRAISLLVATSLCGDRLSGQTLTQVRDIIKASAFWLRRFPSRFSSANNHWMAELAGEYVIACAIQGAEKAMPLKRRIESEVLKQILPDGVGAEQSPTYAAFTAELALLCAIVARAGGTPFSTQADGRLSDFAGFLFWLASPAIAAIGDDDEGHALTFCQHEPDFALSVAAAIAGYAGQPAPLAAPDELRNLLAGPPSGRVAAPVGLKTFEAGGYSVWRGGMGGHAVDLVFDHGPLGYLSIAAHGHADALSIILSIGGRPVLVDPGTYLYQSGGAWRSWFRGTRAHNTLNIDGADQSMIAGPFNWAGKAEARLDKRIDGAEWSLTASHDGYEERFGVRHQRSLERAGDSLVITDRLIGGGRRAEIVFQLAPELSAVAEANAVGIRRGVETIAVLHFPTADIAIARGGKIGEGGWVSPAFGSKIAADRIAWRGAVGPGGVITTLRLP